MTDYAKFIRRREMWRRGSTANEIALAEGVAASTVRAWLRFNGMTSRSTTVSVQLGPALAEALEERYPGEPPAEAVRAILLATLGDAVDSEWQAEVGGGADD